METISLRLDRNQTSLYKWASILALITIFYNIAEGLASVFFGFKDETVALFGFGLDSFVEVISGTGILRMVRRLKKNGNANPDGFEKQALRITGTAFYLLALGLAVTAALNLSRKHSPETTFRGIIIAAVSILTMWVLIHYKVKVGEQLDSEAVLADANCTKACLYLSVVLLVASLGYDLTGIGGMDSIGAVAIAGLSFKEGRESFNKAKGKECSCSGNCTI